MDRSTRPDDGNPTRLIATMVGIVGILLLGSLAWSAVGAMFSALGEATSTLSGARPTPAKLVASAGTPTTPPAPTTRVTLTVLPATGATGAPNNAPTIVVTLNPTLAPTPTLAATPRPAAEASATPVAAGRAPWILLPQPEPGGKVTPGSMTIEARGRGDAPITSMRLELDGAALAASFEQRDTSTWRVSASTQVSPGQHAVRATVVDDRGRSGGFRWTFDAAP